MRALIAEEHSDYGTAENEFKAAVAVAGKPNAWVDLAEFYRKRKRFDESFATLRKAEAADSARDASLVDMGSILLEMKQRYSDGVRLERIYISSGTHTDAGPVCRAHYLAGRMLEKSGDKNSARQEYQAALKLASKYELAQKALNSLS
jgi:tetratricopeptide (TPR) repeat protein